jgi:predicted RNase H-like HicB family nuclease
VLTEYIKAALHHATYEQLASGEWYGEIPLTPGVWATGSTVEATRDELKSVLEDWILVGLRLGHQLPVIDGIDLNVRDVA